eukprot:Nitzschia sp. Nitz4//NODE_611_length_9286_cov_71.495179//1237//1518//NITZ4_additional_000089-RA//1//CDS//3329531999//3375//frame0
MNEGWHIETSSQRTFYWWMRRIYTPSSCPTLVFPKRLHGGMIVERSVERQGIWRLRYWSGGQPMM